MIAHCKSFCNIIGNAETARQSPVLSEKSGLLLQLKLCCSFLCLNFVDKMISGQTSNDFEEGLTPSHQKSFQQPGSHMVTGAGNFESFHKEEGSKDQQHHKEHNNGLPAPQQVVTATNPSSEPSTPIPMPSSRDGRTFVQEEISNSDPKSVAEFSDKSTNSNAAVVSTKRPSLKRMSTSEAIGMLQS